MIGKRELLGIARALQLHPHIVEKDYALGWMLAGIYSHPALSGSWVFKGGTCLKKCYFETYRFSEDLDFTLQDEAHLDESFLKTVFAEISEWVYEQCGLELPPDGQSFEIYPNPRDNPCCQGRLSFRGPVSPSSGGLPRIKLDLTADEVLALSPTRLPIFHPYSDAPEEGIEVLAYAYEEAFAEKVRALMERARPRDLYDVVHLYRHEDRRPSRGVLRDVLEQKCAFKGLRLPQAEDIEPRKEDLTAAWHSMLAHQLPELPPVEAFFGALGDFFSWLHGERVEEPKAGYDLQAGETVIRDRAVGFAATGRGLASLEIIRFAAANRLCVDLDYQGSTRRIEPYSLRRTRDGKIVLHAWNVDRDAHRSYRVDRIQGVRTTAQSFTPRYAVELTPTGPMAVLPTARGA